ncbi:MAG: hypothetical protein Q4P20_06355 [Eubacteriales bacterium]|nr:hypothetical protein [Eubacteriales bacterium]
MYASDDLWHADLEKARSFPGGLQHIRANWEKALRPCFPPCALAMRVNIKKIFTSIFAFP